MDKVKACIIDMSETLRQYPILSGLTTLGVLAICGPSEIGLICANQFVKTGLDILLTTQNVKNPEAKRNERMDLRSRVLPLISPSQEWYKVLGEIILNRSMSILMNKGTDYISRLCDLQTKTIIDITNLSICGLIYLTRMVIPKVEKKNYSAIIDNSSTFIKTNTSTSYITTKTYMNIFLRSLHYGLNKKGINALNCITGEVITPSKPASTIRYVDIVSTVKGQSSALGYDVETKGAMGYAFYLMHLWSYLGYWDRKWISEIWQKIGFKLF
jgi:short-subunit dehydrogenase